ncbi:GNAT family N-acetyltransferase [Undibacterium danionis]|uniref:GNAT family N-acetyltransferase n=1 Tax=Undibacterium danionis TaxID=1812100 RepID=A0ABV6IDA7_9BURK
MLEIRLARSADFEKIWPIFHEIVSAGETYAYARDTNQDQGFQLWMTLPRQTFVIEENGEILGSYFIKTNQSGGGDHVCNCGYMVSSQARGRGVASMMFAHSQNIAKDLGYLAMQFNFVVSTNESAVRLWTQCGFDTVGRLPKAFHHPAHGLVDALIMYKWLAN